MEYRSVGADALRARYGDGLARSGGLAIEGLWAKDAARIACVAELVREVLAEEIANGAGWLDSKPFVRGIIGG